MKAINTMLNEIDTAHARLHSVFGFDGPEQEGPCSVIIQGIYQAIIEFNQGANQAASKPEEDTIWSRDELEVFTDALPGMMAVVEALIPTLTQE